MRTRATATLLALLALAALIPACGDGEEGAESRTAPASGAEAGPTATGPSRPGERSGGAEGAGPEGQREGGGEESPAPIDLSTDPASIDAARVTPSGAVQTLPPSPAAHQVAQENSYASIKAFGAEAEAEEATEITFALVQYLSAKARGEWALACARLYGPLREGLESQAPGEGCALSLGRLMRRVPVAARAEQAKIDVSSVRRDGDRAFVIYKTPATLSADMPLQVEEGVWKVAALEAYVLRPGEAE